MNQNDFMYRAFKSYRSETDKRVLNSERRNLRKTFVELDKFQVKKYLCTINEDWIHEIEKGLVFIEKAVAEERQFIRVEGETVPIEKAKKVSRDSIAHLAKHSNLITRVPEDPKATLVPDGIYIVEKLSDYAVYENRFLYMLLVQLREFIGMRLDKIKKLRMTYICDFSITKGMKNKSRVLDFKQDYHEERYNNPYPLADELSTSLLQRIEDCAQIVNMLLKSNLMIEVAKAPMVKPPITKTNVLKMNNNFKNALVLYDYICEYKGDGYTAEEKIKDFVPFQDLCADEIIEIAELTTFLTYKYGNELSDILETAFLEEEERRRKEEAEKLLERVRRLKKKVAESGMGIEEYMMALEDRNKILEKDSEDLVLARQEIVELNQKIDELKLEIIELNRKIDELYVVIEDKDKEIARLIQKYIDDMEALKRAHALEIQRLLKKHAQEMQAQKDMYEQMIEEMKLAHQKEIEELTESYETKIQKMQEEFDRAFLELKREFEDQIFQMQEEHEAEIRDLNETHKEEIEALNLEHENEVKELTTNYENEINTLNANHEAEVSALNEAHEKHVTEMEAEFNQKLETAVSDTVNEYQAIVDERDRTIAALTAEIESLKEERERMMNSHEASVASLNQRIGELIGERNAKVEDYERRLKDMQAYYEDEYQKKETLDNGIISEKNENIAYLSDENARLNQERDLAVAEMNQVRRTAGLDPTDMDYTSRERFLELEAEFEAFNAFFKNEWKKTKKRIRKELLWTKPEKKKLKNDPDFSKETQNEAFEEEKPEEKPLEQVKDNSNEDVVESNAAPVEESPIEEAEKDAFTEESAADREESMEETPIEETQEEVKPEEPKEETLTEESVDDVEESEEDITKEENTTNEE